MLSVNKVIEVQNYPYGFLQCKASFSVEFSPTKGFRSIFQTINPKTNRVNNPKKSTYSDIVYLKEIDGFVTVKTKSINGIKGINSAAKFVNENFELFTPEQIKHLYNKFFVMIKVSMQAAIIYCGSKFEDLQPLFNDAVIAAADGIISQKNLFSSIVLNEEEIKKVETPNYNPFKTTTLTIG